MTEASKKPAQGVSYIRYSRFASDGSERRGDTVKRILDLHKAGYNAREIARQLSDDDQPAIDYLAITRQVAGG